MLSTDAILVQAQEAKKTLGTASTVCPVASMAPVSWTLMCPLVAAITP